MSKTLSLPQLDHVIRIAERLVTCNNAVNKDDKGNAVISQKTKEYGCFDALKDQSRWHLWLAGLSNNESAPSSLSVQYHFHEFTREHITIAATFTFGVRGATWKVKIVQPVSVDDKGSLLYGVNMTIDMNDPINLAYENCDNTAEFCRHLAIEHLNGNFAISGTVGKNMSALHASDAEADLERLVTMRNEMNKVFNAVNASLSITEE